MQREMEVVVTLSFSTLTQSYGQNWATGKMEPGMQ